MSENQADTKSTEKKPSLRDLMAAQLESDDWKQKLDAARAKREEVLKQRAGERQPLPHGPPRPASKVEPPEAPAGIARPTTPAEARPLTAPAAKVSAPPKDARSHSSRSVARWLEQRPVNPDPVSLESRIRAAHAQRGSPQVVERLAAHRAPGQVTGRINGWMTQVTALATVAVLGAAWWWYQPTSAPAPLAQTPSSAEPAIGSEPMAETIPPQAFRLVPINPPDPDTQTADAMPAMTEDAGYPAATQLSFGRPAIQLDDTPTAFSAVGSEQSGVGAAERPADARETALADDADVAPTADLPDTPPSIDDMLARLAEVAPAGTRVHLSTGAAGPDDAYGLTVVWSPFETGAGIVRYFHGADREAAQRSADAIGADAVDFSAYSPKPEQGTIEVWLGSG